MSQRFVCPNDSEVLIIHIDPSTNPMTEDYICPFCHYKTGKAAAAATLKVVDETYVPPSRKKH